MDIWFLLPSEQWSHTDCTDCFQKSALSRRRLLEYFEAEWTDNLYLSHELEQQHQHRAGPTWVSCPPTEHSDLSFLLKD